MQKPIVCAVSASLALLSAHTVAEAKGPKGSSGQGTSIHGASSAQGQALGSNSWGGGAPGWGNDGSRKGWDDSPQPPGWTKNTKGQGHGWGDNETAPGLAKR